MMASSSQYFPLPSVAAVKSDQRLRAFIDAHYEKLWRVIRRFGVPEGRVDDAAQEVLLVLSKRIGEVDPNAEWAFAVGTARRIAADSRKKELVRPQGEGDDALLGLADPRAHQALTVADERQLLDRLLDDLPEEQREALVLVELEGMTMAETAELLNVPQGTIASRLRRARTHLETAAQQMRATLNKQGWSL